MMSSKIRKANLLLRSLLFILKDRTEIENHQRKRIKELLIYAYSHTKFYRNYWKENGITRKMLLEDNNIIDKIPIIDKVHLKSIYSECAKKFAGKKIIKATSGTSGVKSKVIWGKDKVIINDIEFLRSLILNKVNIFKPIVEFYRIITNEEERVYNNLSYRNGFPLFHEIPPIKKIETMIKIVNNLSPSAILIHANLLNWIFSKYKLSSKTILTGGAPISPRIKNNFWNKLKTKIIEFYASEEFGYIGFELEKNTIRINEDFLYVEILKNNKKIRKGRGEVIITDLYNKVMPIIRYRVGDTAKIIPIYQDDRIKLSKISKIKRSKT